MTARQPALRARLPAVSPYQLLRYSGAFAALTSTVVLLGWLGHWAVLVRVFATWAPMKWNTAAGLITCGVAAILLSVRRRRAAAVCGALPAAIGLATLLEYGLGRSFGIDVLVTPDYLTPNAAFPGRMSGLTATCLLALGTGLVCASLGKAPAWRFAVPGLSSCCVAIIALLSLLGYVTGMEQAYSWGALTHMAVLTATGFLALSVALFIWAWERARSARFNLARWLPVTGSVTLIAVVVCISAVSLTRLRDSIYWRKHSYEVLISSQAVLGHLVDSQRGMRGYVLTGQEASLATYRDGVLNLRLQLAELLHLTVDNSAQQQRLRQVGSDLEAIIDYSRRLLAARDSRGLQRAIELESTGEGRMVVDRTRADMAAFTDEERRLLVERDAQAQNEFDNTANVLIAGSVLAAMLLVLAHLMASREVNRRRRTEAKLEEVSALQSAILDSANYAIISTTVDGTVTTFNAAAEQWLGYSAAEVVGKATPALWHDANELAARATALTTQLGRPVAPGFDVLAARASREGRDENECTLVRRDGSRFPALVSASILTDADGRTVGYLGVIGDITERRRHEAELRLSEERFRHAFDDAPIGMCLVSPQGRLMKVNRAICMMLGYAEEELLQTDFQSITHPDDLAADLQSFGRVLQGQIASYHMEKRYLHRDGSPVYTRLSVSLVRDRDERPLYFVFQIENITHRREIDRLKREFISTVSHELRTPLTSIQGSLGLVNGGALGPLPEKVAAMVRIAHQNSVRLVRIINDILDVEKIESGRLDLHIGTVAVEPLLRQALEENRAYGAKYGVDFVLEGVPERAEVRADPHRLMQVFANLLSNAAKFSPAGGVVLVRARSAAEGIRFEVQDHGLGIPEDFRGRVFEKFAQAEAVSTRRVDGTGLGLAITRQLVQAMRGSIGFTTATGQGTTFYFDLPAPDNSA